MIYVMLAGTIISFFLGFLLHAFYFSHSNLSERLANELERLRPILKNKAKQHQEALEEIKRTNMHNIFLERQLEKRNEDLGILLSMALQRDEEIRLLEIKVSEIRPGARRQEEGSITFDPFKSNNSQRIELSGVKTPDLKTIIEPKANRRTRDQDPAAPALPLWKHQLNNILSVLDALEKEPRE
jgi:hypothetical protein